MRLIASRTTLCARANGSRGRFGFLFFDPLGRPPSFAFSLDDLALAFDFTLPMSAPMFTSCWCPHAGHVISMPAFYRTVSFLQSHFQIRPLPQLVADELDAIATLMWGTAERMEYFGGFRGEMRQRAHELAGAATIARSWAMSMRASRKLDRR